MKNNPTIEVEFPISNETQFVTRDYWKELSRELEAQYPAVHLWLYRLYRISSEDKDGGQIICLRLGGIEAFSKAKHEILLGNDKSYRRIDSYKTYLTLVPRLTSVIIPPEHFYSYYNELRALDPIVAENLFYLLFIRKVPNISFYAFELYEGWDRIFSNAIKARKDYTIPSLTGQEDDSCRPALKESLVLSNREKLTKVLSNREKLTKVLSNREKLTKVLSNREKLTKDQEKLVKTFNLFLMNPIEFYIKAQEALDEYRRVFNQYQLASEELRLQNKVKGSNEG